MKHSIKPYRILILLLLLSFLVSLGTAKSCQNTITIEDTGTTSNQITFTISPDSGYYYPSDGLWAASIPRQAENISVRDGEGDNLEQEVKESKYLNKRLRFWNDERVSDHEEYTFNITYTMPRGVVLYGQSAYFSQIIPFSSSCEDGVSTTVSYPPSWELNSSSTDNYEQTADGITFGAIFDTLTLWFSADEDLASVGHYKSGIFNITVPSYYSNHILTQTETLNSYLPTVEAHTGIETPERFHLIYLPLKSENISEEAAGQYYGGRIEIKSTQLANKDIVGLEILLHELIHGYNNKLSFGSPDWWWEEGTANYLAHRVLEEEGHNVSLFTPSRERIRATFENCEYERSFITDWSPIEQPEGGIVTLDPIFPCGRPEIEVIESSSSEDTSSSSTDSSTIDYITDKDQLGYKYSELIVSDIFANTSAGVSDVYNLMQRRNVSFSNSTSLMNNQINYFASKATGKDLTTFLQSRGINTESWESSENEIQEARHTIRSIESGYRFQLFQDYLNDIESVEKDFYYGRFSATDRSDTIVQNAEDRNQTVHETLSRYQDVRDHVLSLEAETEPPFYERELDQLNQSLDLVRNKEFETTQTEIADIRHEANQKSERIASYQESVEDVESRIESATVLTSPFMFNAPSQLAQSQESFRSGNLKTARASLSKAESKINQSKIWAAIFYLAILGSIGYLFYRRRNGENSLSSILPIRVELKSLKHL